MSNQTKRIRQTTTVGNARLKAYSVASANEKNTSIAQQAGTSNRLAV